VFVSNSLGQVSAKNWQNQLTSDKDDITKSDFFLRHNVHRKTMILKRIFTYCKTNQ